MNQIDVPHGLTRLKVTLVALTAALVALALTASTTRAASPGDPFTAEFNYAALTVTAAGNSVDQLVLKPEDGVGTIEFAGTYTDSSGNFTLPAATGLDFPDVSVPLTETASIDGQVSLAADSTGTYDESTGRLDLDLKVSLILGTDNLQELGNQLGMSFPPGPLSCQISPLNVSASTTYGWPHAGKNYENPAALTEGAVAGSWTEMPPAVSVIEDNASFCGLVGGVIEQKGGLWLANSSAAITNETMPAPVPCGADEIGTYPPDCVPKVAAIGSLKLVPKRAKVKAGKKVKLTVKVTNTGNVTFNGKVNLKSSNKKVKVPRSVKARVGAGKTVAIKVTVKAARNARGKATITARAGGKTARSTVTVQKAKKKKKSKKRK